MEALLKSSAIEIEEDSLEVDLNLTQSDALATHERNSDPVSRESVPLSRQGDRSASYQPEGFRSQSTDAPSDEEYDPDPLISLFNNRVVYLINILDR